MKLTFDLTFIHKVYLPESRLEPMLFVTCAPFVVNEATCDEGGVAGSGPAPITMQRWMVVFRENIIQISFWPFTPRERSIIEALIKHGGRMTQAEIRYETVLPRSSLTMVLIFL